MSVREVRVQDATGDGTTLLVYQGGLASWPLIEVHVVGGCEPSVYLSPKHARKLAKHLRKLADQAEGLNK